MIPAPAELDNDLPDRVRMYLQQAIDSKHAPDGAAMLAASSIDAMLKVKNYAFGTLYQRIDKAVEDNLLTPDMGEWAHAVRIEANHPRHADLTDPHISIPQAEQMIEFARALGDFMFVFPARIMRGKRGTEIAKS